MRNSAIRRGRLIWLAHAAWISYFVLALSMYGVGTVLYFNQLREVCMLPADQCQAFDYATAIEAAQLEASGWSLDTYATLRAGTFLVFALLPLTLSVLIFARKRREPIALFISAFLIALTVVGEPLLVVAARFPILDWPVRLIDYFWIVSLALFFGVFPNGRVVPRLYWGVILFFCITYLLNGTFNLIDFGSRIGELLAWGQWLSVLFGGAAAQVYRYLRVSTLEERRQTRWVLFGVAMLALLLVAQLGFTALTGIAVVRTSAALLPRFINLVMLRAMFLCIPLSIGVAILRSQLFDIDVIIRRTLIYGTLTALFTLIYVGNVIVLQTLLRPLIGADSELATVASTLIIVALFQPLRKRLQLIIDRRFYRRRYDSQKTLEAFNGRMRNETNLNQLSGNLLGVVQDTLQPAHVSLWLRQGSAGHATVQTTARKESESALP